MSRDEHDLAADRADVADVAAVTAVLLGYCRALDEKDWVSLASCFTPDCETCYQGRRFDGVERLVDVMRRLHDPLDASLHRLTNVEVVLDGDTARARSCVDALLVHSSHEAGALHQVVGTYADTLVRTPRGWRLRTRTFVPVWITERGALPMPSTAALAELHRVPVRRGDPS